MKLGKLFLATAIFSSAANAQIVDVYRGGPEIKVVRAPDWQLLEYELDKRIHRTSKREALIITWSVMLPSGRYRVERPWTAVMDGRVHYLIPGKISDSGPGKWVENISTHGLMDNSWTAWRIGHLMVDAETGEVADIPVVVVTCDRCDFKDTGPIFRFKRPKGGATPATIELNMFESKEEADAENSRRELARLESSRREADQAMAQHYLDLNRRRADNPKKSQIGAEVCQDRSGDRWLTAGYTESVSPDNGKIQVRVVSGPARGEILWEDPTDWELCSIERTR